MDISEHSSRSHEKLTLEDAQLAYEPEKLPYGDAVPLGLAGFGFVTVESCILALYKWSIGAYEKQFFLIGDGMFIGGLAQFVAGIFCFLNLDTFHGVAFTSFGCIWMSNGVRYYLSNTDTILVDPSKKYIYEIQEGIAHISLCIWVFTLLMCNLRKPFAVFTLFILLNLYVYLRTIEAWVGGETLGIVASIIGIILGLNAFYNGLSIFVGRCNPSVKIPLGKRLF
ncbi:Meiotically up-regulated gene 86 protein [Zancudomyces culisetae]|uniref:Meiotically up-regulated gene 86 protein n=1 Tax=Zancudomyces culisetae TaxID=1213189 RepID=A0A1R1PG46_ZANCU|nr:Meiotically up-regulated gene 86 protein [Zancudomyces culisetae]OMH79917.1 Meiotically up-regulated gene 86 protein [Zancudomyces culisetae]|eukprot:OMH79299.1 Meiotically up-regulated gene 86 protein [Zancudomyces culisetae]